MFLVFVLDLIDKILQFFFWKILKICYYEHHMGISRTNSDKLETFGKSCFAQNERILAKIWISTFQRHGAGACAEAF